MLPRPLQKSAITTQFIYINIYIYFSLQTILLIYIPFIFFPCTLYFRFAKFSLSRFSRKAQAKCLHAHCREHTAIQFMLYFYTYFACTYFLSSTHLSYILCMHFANFFLFLLFLTLILQSECTMRSSLITRKLRKHAPGTKYGRSVAPKYGDFVYVEGCPHVGCVLDANLKSKVIYHLLAFVFICLHLFLFAYICFFFAFAFACICFFFACICFF